MALKLTARQTEVFEFIKMKMAEKNGEAPAFKEIAEHFNFSTKAARNHVDALVKKNCLSHAIFTKRSIMIPDNQPKVIKNELIERVAHKPIIADSQRDILEIPIYRKIFETEPYLREDSVQGVLPVRYSDAQYVRDDCFAFPFDYKSMSAAGVLQSDIVIARKVEGLNNNETVLVNVRNMNTMRRVFFNGNQVILFAENKDYEPLWYDLKEIEVICKCIGVYRFNI